MVMEVSVGNSDPISAVGNIEKTIKIILSKAQVTGKVAMINPDVGRFVDTDSIAVGSINLGDLEVSKNNILLATNVEADTGKRYIVSVLTFSQNIGN